MNEMGWRRKKKAAADVQDIDAACEGRVIFSGGEMEPAIGDLRVQFSSFEAYGSNIVNSVQIYWE